MARAFEFPPRFHFGAKPARRALSDCVGWLKGLPGRYQSGLPKETKMPKLKTKSGVKKRFKFTASGKVKHGVAGKRHRLISHNAKYIRTNRGTSVLSDSDRKSVVSGKSVSVRVDLGGRRILKKKNKEKKKETEE